MTTDEIALPEVEVAPERRRRLPLPRTPRSLAVVIVILLVLGGFAMLYKSKTDKIGELRRQIDAMEAVQQAEADAVSISQRFLVLLTTYNADTLERQRAEVLKLAAGRFMNEYTLLTGDEFLAALKTAQADSSGKVVHIAATTLKGSTAAVLALVEVTTKNKDLKQPRVDRNLIELSLVRTGGGWRVDAVSIIGTIS